VAKKNPIKTILKTFYVMSLLLCLATLSQCGKRPTPEALLNNLKATYSGLQDFHEVTASEVINIYEGNRKSTCRTEMYFKKPNKMYYQTTSGAVSAVAACDGKDSYLYVSSLNECVKDRAPGSISEFYRKTAGMGLINPSHVVLETFLIDGLLPEGGVSSSSIEERCEKVGKGHVCHVVNLTFPTGEKQRLWIGTEDHFIWKNEITITGKALQNRTGSETSSAGKDEEKESRIILVSTETMEVVEANRRIDDSRFTFTVPDGVKVVSAFTSDRKVGRKVNLIGKRAPVFSFKDRSGKKRSLTDFRGRVVVLDFWDSLCKPCVEDLKKMQKIQEKLGTAGPVILGINEEKDTIQKEKFIDVHKLTFPMLDDEDGTVSRNYSVEAFPRIIIINEKGDITSDLLGAQSEETLNDELRKAGLK